MTINYLLKPYLATYKILFFTHQQAIQFTMKKNNPY